MRQEFVEYYRAVMDLFRAHTAARDALGKIISTNTDVKELCDEVYALHCCTKMLEEMKRQCDSLETLAERVCCLLYVASNMDGPIRTAHCRGTPKVTSIVTVPKRSTNPEAYESLMKFLGVPKELMGNDEDKEVVRCHWPGLVVYLSNLLAEGKPLPPGIDPSKTYPAYAVTVHGVKGVDEPVA